MFLSLQNKEHIQSYRDYLSIVGSLSELFSDSKIPYLYYRIAEKIFCKSFIADDLSRSDVSVDARKDSIGIALKTFLIGNNRTFQKVAEFNNDRPSYISLSEKDLIRRIAYLRNKRIDFTEQVHAINSSIYHCVIRDEGLFKLFEEPLDRINIDSICDIKSKNNSISFNDGINEYSFLLSKSTLQKRFKISKIIEAFEVKILKDPIDVLQRVLNTNQVLFKEDQRVIETIFLPLYGNNYTVFPQSGLNQWNANGRVRDLNEVYIPIPSEVHKILPDFFPSRDDSFSLKLPSGEIMKSKVCQDNRKALMSYSNKELGKWILRSVLKIKEGEILTYAKLQEVGIDSVRIDKISSEEYEINFAKIGSYEQFMDSRK